MLQLFIKGGPLMWPMLAVSLLALTTVFERIFAAIRQKRSARPADIKTMLRELRNGEVKKAIETGALSTDYRATCLAMALQDREPSFTSAYQHHASRMLRSQSRGLGILDTAITLAPLLGLLGTVTGMIHAFGLMGASELEAPAAITGGIAEALIATAFGLIIASFALVPFNWMNSRLEQAQHDLQDLGTQAEPLVARLDESANELPKTTERTGRFISTHS